MALSIGYEEDERTFEEEGVVSITLTPAQAAALARVASEYDSPLLQLHQVGKDPDLFVTTSGQGEPDLRISDDGRVEPLPEASKPAHA